MARSNHNKHHSSTTKLVFLISCAGLLGAALIADFLWASSSSAAPAFLSIASSWALEKSGIVVVQNVTPYIAHHKVSTLTKCPILWVYARFQFQIYLFSYLFLWFMNWGCEIVSLCALVCREKWKKKIWNYSVLFPLISFWSYTHLISGCHCSTWKNFVVIDYDPTYICREKMSKIEKNVFLRDSYLQLMLIYLHLSYNGRRCHQHLYLDLMEQQYRLKIFCMCLQDMAHLTMWESVHIWTFCLFNVRFSTKCLLVQCSSSMLVDVPISINWHLEPE